MLLKNVLKFSIFLDFSIKNDYNCVKDQHYDIYIILLGGENMKRIGNIICTVLILIGAIVAICYATHKEEQPFKDGFNGFDENGVPVYYWDNGQTERRERERKIIAGVGFGGYSLAIIGGR